MAHGRPPGLAGPRKADDAASRRGLLRGPFLVGAGTCLLGGYLNLQEPFRRYDGGFDTLDHELDFWLPAEGDWVVKDAELFEERVREGRYSTARAEAVRDTGRAIAELLTNRFYWWDSSGQGWSPPDDWLGIDPPDGWDLRGRARPG